MSFTIDLRGRSALVTGASRGIGEATARALGLAGARVLVAGRDEPALQELSADLPGSSVLLADLGDLDGVAALAEAALHVDVLVNNAGKVELAPAAALDGPAVEEQFAVNVFAPLLLASRIGAAMASRGSGSIINVSSALALRGTALSAAYAGTKGALDAITTSLAAEYGPAGVRVNSVRPGPVTTPHTLDSLRAVPGAVDRLAAMTPLGRIADAEDVADVIVFLAGDGARFVTGQFLGVDGGLANTTQFIDPAVLAAMPG